MNKISIEDLNKKIKMYDLVILEIEPNKFKIIKYKIGYWKCITDNKYQKTMSKAKAEYMAKDAVEEAIDGSKYRAVIYYYDQFDHNGLSDLFESISLLHKLDSELIYREYGIAYGEIEHFLKTEDMNKCEYSDEFDEDEDDYNDEDISNYYDSLYDDNFNS